MMSVTIKPSKNNTYLVNDKEVYQDANGNWLAKNIQLFTAQEIKAWCNYKAIAVDGKVKNATIKFNYKCATS